MPEGECGQPLEVLGQDTVQLVPVKEQTVWDRIQEFKATVLMCTSESNQTSCIRSLNKFAVYLSKAGMDRRTVHSYGAYLLETGLSQANTSVNLKFCKQFLRWCWTMGYSQERWHEFIPNIRQEPRGLPKILRQSEYELLRQHTQNADQDWLIVLSWHTGLRLKDCCYMVWADVDRTTQMISLVPHKTRHITAKPIYMPYLAGSDLYLGIEKRYEARDKRFDPETGYVCPVMAEAYDGCDKTVSQMYRRLFDRAGLEHLSFKHFRSTFESRLANSGMNMALAAQITGRSSIQSLMRYVRPDAQAAREGIAKALDIHNQMEGFK